MKSKLNIELVKHANGMVTLYSVARQAVVFQTSDASRGDKEKRARDVAASYGWKIVKVVNA